MGHYASEMASDTKYTDLHREWGREWPALRAAVEAIRLADMTVADLLDVNLVVSLDVRPSECGPWHAPVVDAPHDYTRAKEAAKRLIEKFAQPQLCGAER